MEKSWQGSCGRHPEVAILVREAGQMILGFLSALGAREVSGAQGGALWGKVGSVERGCGACVHGVCVFLGLEECGEVGVWRAGRVESRMFLAVELGGGNS